MDLDSRVTKKKAGLSDEMLLKVINGLYKDHITNKEVRRKIQATIGEYDEMLATVGTSSWLPIQNGVSS